MKEPTKRYVWLNMETGRFSNSWTDEDFKDINETPQSLSEGKAEWKLIEYFCHNDDDFEFMNQMKLR